MSDTITKNVDVKVGTPGAPESTRQISALGRAMRDLNAAGRDSGLSGRGGLVGILRGAGIAALFKIGADAVKVGIESWDKYKEGTISAREAVEKTIQTVPILGAVWGAEFAVLDHLSGAAGRYAAALKEIADNAKEYARQEAQTKLFEKIRDSAYAINHPESKGSLAKLTGEREVIDRGFERMRQWRELQKQLAEEEAEPTVFQNQRKLHNLRRDIRELSMSPDEMQTLQSANKENAAAFWHEWTDVGEKAVDALKAPFAKAGATIGAQFAEAEKLANDERVRNLFSATRFKLFWPGGGGGAQGLGSMIEDALEAGRDKIRRILFPHPGKPDGSGYLSQTVPATEGRYLTGGGQRQAVPIEGMDKTLQFQREIRDAVRDLARSFPAPSTFIDLR